MAFNHIGNCSCPVGCCDCGPVNPHATVDKIVHEQIQSLVPKDLYMLRGLYNTESNMYERSRSLNPYLGMNEFYVGEIDPILTVRDAVGICITFYAWLWCQNFLHEDNGAKYMRELMSRLEDTGDFKEALRPYLEFLYMKTKPYL